MCLVLKFEKPQCLQDTVHHHAGNFVSVQSNGISVLQGATESMAKILIIALRWCVSRKGDCANRMFYELLVHFRVGTLLPLISPDYAGNVCPSILGEHRKISY